MADIRHTMSLDDSRFAQGLKHAEGLAERNVRAMQTGFGRLSAAFDGALRFAVIDQAVKRGFGIAQSAVRGYADEFDFAEQELKQFQSAFHDFNLSLGRDLFNLVSGPGSGWVEEALRGLDRWRVAAVNAVSDTLFFGGAGNGAGVDEARKMQESLDRQISQMEKFRDMRAELMGGLATASGRNADAATLAEQERHRANLKDIGGMGLVNNSAELLELQRLETERHEAAIAAIAEKADQEKALEGRRREDALHGLEVDRERMGLQQMRLNGMKDEADLEEIRLQFRERAREIERSDALDADQKQRALDDLANAQVGTELALRNSREKSRSTLGFSGSDVADAKVRGLIFGAGGAGKGPVDAVAKNTKDSADQAKRQTDLLKSIDRGIAHKFVGAFG